jgi:hypothetical protein
MARTEGSRRGVEIRLFEPAPKVGGRRLDALLDEPSQRLEKAHYMFLVLAATELARILDARTSELSVDEAAVVTFLRDDRSRSIVEYLPRI